MRTIPGYLTFTVPRHLVQANPVLRRARENTCFPAFMTSMAPEALDVRTLKQRLRREIKHRLQGLQTGATLSQCW